VNIRKAIRVLKTPVTLLLLLAILGYGAYWGYKQVSLDTSTPSIAETACTMQDVGKTLTPDRVTVQVLNGGTQGTHAKTTRNFLQYYGFHVIRFANSDRDVTTTTIISNSANDPEVLLVQKMFKGAVTEGDGRVSHLVDVIVPTKYQDLPNPPAPTVEVNGPVCLPVVAASTGSATPIDYTPSPNSSTTPSKKK
jgi:hypothetical protein